MLKKSKKLMLILLGLLILVNSVVFAAAPAKNLTGKGTQSNLKCNCGQTVIELYNATPTPITINGSDSLNKFTLQPNEKHFFRAPVFNDGSYSVYVKAPGIDLDWVQILWKDQEFHSRDSAQLSVSNVSSSANYKWYELVAKNTNSFELVARSNDSGGNDWVYGATSNGLIDHEKDQTTLISTLPAQWGGIILVYGMSDTNKYPLPDVTALHIS